jgi:hypothetical protein
VVGSRGARWFKARPDWGERQQRQQSAIADRLSLPDHLARLLLVAVGVTAVAGLVLWLALDRPPLAVSRTPGGQSAWSAANTLNAIKIVLSVVAGIGGVVALTVAYRKQDQAEVAERRAEVAERREDTKLFNERFGRASDQLGSDKAAVRLAGAYAMAGLADDWEAGRQTCVDVLCAYLRMPYTPPDEESTMPGRSARSIRQAPYGRRGSDTAVRTPDPTRAGSDRDLEEERQVRHTVLHLIGDHLRPDDPSRLPSWHGLTFDFTGATFDGGSLAGIRVTTGTALNLAGATFAGGTVSFVDATFAGGTVSFDNATFSGGTVDLSTPKAWDVPPSGISGTESGVAWPSAEHLASHTAGAT